MIFYSKYLDRQAHANSEDPDQTSTEFDIYSKEWQLRANIVDPDKTPTLLKLRPCTLFVLSRMKEGIS